jgi:hypothetical protein
MTERIRWEDGQLGDILGYAGTIEPWAFRIYKPAGFSWVLIAELPGMAGNQGYKDDPEVLKARAEELLAGFVSSLGAIFTDTVRERVQQAQDLAMDEVLRMLAGPATTKGTEDR